MMLDTLSLSLLDDDDTLGAAASSPFDSQYDQVRSRILAYADQYGIDRDIGIWQLWKENKFKASGCSGKGACGIAQFISTTAARFGVDRNSVESSLNGWGKYMRWLLDRYSGDYRKALAGYNAGEGNVDKYGGVPPFGETQDYVSYVMSNAGNGGGGGVLPVAGLPSNWYLWAFGAVALVLLLDND